MLTILPQSSEDALLLTAKPRPSTKQSSLFGREPPARLQPLEGTAVEPKRDPAPSRDFSPLTTFRGDTTEGIETALNIGVEDQQLDSASLPNPPLAPSSPLSLPLVSSQTSRYSHCGDHHQDQPLARDTPSDSPAQTTLSDQAGSSQSCSTASSQDSGASSTSDAIRPGSTFLTPQPSFVVSHSPPGKSPSAGSLAETARALFNLEQHQLDNLARFGGLIGLSHSPSESGRLVHSPVFARASGSIDEKGVGPALEYISQPLDPSVTTVRTGNGDRAGASERSALPLPIDHWGPRQPSKSPHTGRDSNRPKPKPNSSPQPAIKSLSKVSPSETPIVSTSRPYKATSSTIIPTLLSTQSPQRNMALGKRRSLRIVESDPEPDSDSEVVSKAIPVKMEVPSKSQKRDKPKQKEESAAGPLTELQRKSKRRSIAPVQPNEPPYESAPPTVLTPERQPQLKRPPTPPIDSPPGTEVQRPPTPPFPITPLPQVEAMSSVEADAATPVQKSGGKRPAELEVKEPLRKKRKSAVPPEDKDEPMEGNAASGEKKKAAVKELAEKEPAEKKGLKIKLKVQPKSTSTSKSTSPAPSHAESTAGSDGRSVESGKKSARGLRGGRRSSTRFNPDEGASEGMVGPPVMPSEEITNESPEAVPQRPDPEVKSKGKKLSKEKKSERSGGQGSATAVSAKHDSTEVLAPADIPVSANPKAAVDKKENPGTAGKRRPRRIVESSPEKEDDEMDVDVDDLFGDEAPTPGPVTAASPIPALMAKEGRGDGSVVGRSVKVPSETSASPSKATKVEPKATTVNSKDDAPKAKEEAPAKSKDEANSKPKDEANPKPKDEAKRTLPKLTKKKTLPTDSPSDTAPPVVKKLLDKSSASTPQSAVFKKKKPLAGSKGTTPVPAMSFLQSTMAALSQKRERDGRDGGDKTDKGKKEKEKEKRKVDWGGEWVLTAEQQAEFEAARPEREAARKIRDGWKVNAVNLQESKDAYRIDSVQRRVLPLAGIQPTPSTTPSAFAARLWEMDNDAIF